MERLIHKSIFVIISQISSLKLLYQNNKVADIYVKFVNYNKEKLLTLADFSEHCLVAISSLFSRRYK